MKRIQGLWLFVFSLLIGSQIHVCADAKEYSISGEITFKKNHDIIVEIINKEEYDKNLASKYTIIITINEKSLETKKINFSVTGVPVGDYIVKVYQDLNENGKFDFALIGGEPLGTYKKPGFTLGRPSFKSLSFNLTENLDGIEIKL